MFTGINYDDLYYLVLAMSAKEYRSEEILVHGPKKGETGSYPENTTLVSEKVLAGYSLPIIFSHHTSSQCFKARRFDRVAPAIFK